ncbi:MAG: DUF5719 family protein [Acidobacteriota bacterium]
MASDFLILPHVLTGGGYSTRLWIANPGVLALELQVELLDSKGRRQAVENNPRLHSIDAGRLLDVRLDAATPEVASYVRIKVQTEGGRVIAVALTSGETAGSSFSVQALRPVRGRVVFPHLAQDRNYYTGYSVVNPYDFPIRYEVEVFDKDGARVTGIERWIGAFEKHSELLASLLSADQVGGRFVIDAEWPVSVVAVIATASGSAIANLPAH